MDYVYFTTGHWSGLSQREAGHSLSSIVDGGGGTVTNCGSSDMGCINDTVDPCYSGHSPACMS